MFLTQSYKFDAVDSNPSTGYRMLYESECKWNNLVMGMSRLEHDAIVNEDSHLLSEGLSEFGKKVKRWFQWAGQEFLRYIDKVLDTWTNLQNRFRTWNFDLEAMKKKINSPSNSGKTAKISEKQAIYIDLGIVIASKSETVKKMIDRLCDAADKHYKDDKSNALQFDLSEVERDLFILFGAGPYITFYSDGTKMANSQNLSNDKTKYEKTAIIKKFIGRDAANSKYDDVALTANQLTKAANFIKDGRVRCIKTLQYVRNSFAKIINRGIKASDNESEDVKQIKRVSSNMRETINSFISEINKATNACISALSKLSDKNTGKRYIQGRYLGTERVVTTAQGVSGKKIGELDYKYYFD